MTTVLWSILEGSSADAAMKVDVPFRTQLSIFRRKSQAGGENHGNVGSRHLFLRFDVGYTLQRLNHQLQCLPASSYPLTSISRMSELRLDPLSSRWVIVAKNRAARPDEFQVPPVRRVASRCPFCRGNESETPETLANYPSTAPANEWRVRVVLNLYPAVVPLADKLPKHTSTSTTNPTQHPEVSASSSLFRCEPGDGVHEVFIECPEHVASFSDVPDDVAQFVFAAYRDRMLLVRSSGRMQSAQIFKNVRVTAGASIEHGHSQMIALSAIPSGLSVELANSQAWHHNHQACLLCSMVADEMKQGTRIVARSNRFVAYCPYASRFPFETWILPVEHASHYEEIHDDAAGELGLFMRDIVRRIETVTQRAGYNYLLHSAPFNLSSSPSFHWHWEVFPRISTTAGFEWGSGYFINSVAPEEAANLLRKA